MSEETQVEEKTEEKQSVELSDDLQAFIEKIENLSVIELATLVKALEEKFGVSASAAVAVAAPAAGGGAGDAGAAEDKDSFDVILAAAGDKKIPGSACRRTQEYLPDTCLRPWHQPCQCGHGWNESGDHRLRRKWQCRPGRSQGKGRGTLGIIISPDDHLSFHSRGIRANRSRSM